MAHNFDEIIDRGKNSLTYSAKWQGFSANYEGYSIDEATALPMWVADMDLRAPQEVVDAIVKRAAHGIYGYVAQDANRRLFDAAAGWFLRRYGWKADPADMFFSPGIVPVINMTVQAFTDPADGVIVMQPVYYPFANAVNENGRTLVNVPLLCDDGYYTIDYASLEEACKQEKNRLLIFSSPHNPVGRVWKKEELTQVFDICARHGVLVFCDEIHADLIMPGHAHTAAGTLDAHLDCMILAHAPSKTFNLAGLSVSIITVPNTDLRRRLKAHMEACCLPSGNVGNIFGPVAGIAAYTHGDAYVDELCAYLDGNIRHIADFLKERLPQVSLRAPEGTYLIWPDFAGTGLSAEEIYRKAFEEAGVIGDPGKWFGKGGDTFIRYNVACPRARVEEMCRRLYDAFA